MSTDELGEDVGLRRRAQLSGAQLAAMASLHITVSAQELLIARTHRARIKDSWAEALGYSQSNLS